MDLKKILNTKNLYLILILIIIIVSLYFILKKRNVNESFSPEMEENDEETINALKHLGEDIEDKNNNMSISDEVDINIEDEENPSEDISIEINTESTNNNSVFQELSMISTSLKNKLSSYNIPQRISKLLDKLRNYEYANSGKNIIVRVYSKLVNYFKNINYPQYINDEIERIKELLTSILEEEGSEEMDEMSEMEEMEEERGEEEYALIEEEDNKILLNQEEQSRTLITKPSTSNYMMQPPISINVNYNTKNAISDSNIANDDIINRSKFRGQQPNIPNYNNQQYMNNNQQYMNNQQDMNRGIYRLENNTPTKWNTVPNYYVPETGSKYYEYNEFERDYESKMRKRNNTLDNDNSKDETNDKQVACPVEINKPWSNYQTGDN